MRVLEFAFIFFFFSPSGFPKIWFLLTLWCIWCWIQLGEGVAYWSQARTQLDYLQWWPIKIIWVQHQLSVELWQLSQNSLSVEFAVAIRKALGFCAQGFEPRLCYSPPVWAWAALEPLQASSLISTPRTIDNPKCDDKEQYVQIVLNDTQLMGSSQ